VKPKRHGPPSTKDQRPRPATEARRAAIARAPAKAELPPRPWSLERKPSGHVIVRDAGGNLVSFFASTVINHVVNAVNAAARGEDPSP
jgi:hypothetical protein